MKLNDKGQHSMNGSNQLLHVDLHDFIQREQAADSMELASEFGLTLRDIKMLKRKMGGW